jgi:exopolysaccharide production protein ExoQ
MTSTAYPVPYLGFNNDLDASGRRWAKVAWTIPIFCFFFLLLGHNFDRSLLLDEQFNIDEVQMQEQVETGTLKFRLAFLGIGFVGALLLVAPHGDSLRIRNLLAVCILATVGWAMLSIFWSNDAPLTLRRVVTLVCSFVGVLGIARTYRALDMCWLAFVFTLAMVVLGVLAEVTLGTFRPWESGYRFAGLVHPNTQGVELSILIFTSFLLRRQYPNLRLFLGTVMAAAIVGLIMTKSRTSAACCLIGFIALWALNTSFRVKVVTAAALIMAGSLFMGALLTMGVDDPDGFANVLRMGREEGPGSLTGRIPIWITLTEDIAKRPWTGFGFNSYFDDDVLAYIAEEHEWAVPNAHNAYLETVLNTGYIGLGLLLATLLVGMVLLSTTRVRTADVCYSMFFALGTFALLSGCFESIMVINFNFPPCLLAAGLCRVAFFEDVPTDSAESRPGTPLSTVLRN